MSEQDNIKVALAFYDAWNAGDLSLNDPYEADDLTVYQPGAPGPLNKEQARMYLQNFLNAFPGSRFEVLMTVAQGDYVVHNWRVTGTNSGPLQTPSGATIPPTGKHTVTVGSTTSEIKNGKLQRYWAFWDMAGLLGQMGLLPPM